MSERLRIAYLKQEEKRIKKRVDSLPWNRNHLAKMRYNGRQYRKRHPQGGSD